MKISIGNLLFYLLCAILLIAILCQFGILPFRITYFLSGSMMPKYKPGDLAVFYTGKIDDLKPGNVILFEKNEIPVIHRVVNIEQGEITTQGDANNAPDVGTIDHIEGRLIFAVPKLGYVIDYSHILISSVKDMFS